jgi:hypothetical protein
MVFLAGKAGRTIQLEEDGTKHIHKTKQQQKQETSTSSPSSIEQIHNLLATMDGKLDRLLNLTERK